MMVHEGVDGGRSHGGGSGRRETRATQKTERRKATHSRTEGGRSHGGALLWMLGEAKETKVEQLEVETQSVKPEGWRNPSDLEECTHKTVQEE